MQEQTGSVTEVAKTADRVFEAKWGASVFTRPSGQFDFRQLEKWVLEAALSHAGGNQTEAARLLGLSRDQVRYRMVRHGIGGELATTNGDAP